MKELDSGYRKRGPPRREVSGTPVQKNQQISTCRWLSTAGAVAQSKKVPSSRLFPGQLACLGAVGTLLLRSLGPLSAARWSSSSGETQRRRQKRASSFSPPLRKPCGIAEGRESSEDSSDPPWPRQVEKGVAQAKLFIAGSDVLQSGFSSDIPRIERIPLDFNLSSASSRF